MREDALHPQRQSPSKRHSAGWHRTAIQRAGNSCGYKGQIFICETHLEAARRKTAYAVLMAGSLAASKTREKSALSSSLELERVDARRPPDFDAAASSEYSSAFRCLNSHLVGAGKSNHQRGTTLRDVSEISPTARKDWEPTERNLRELLGKDGIAVHAALVGSRWRNLRMINGGSLGAEQVSKRVSLNLGASAPIFLGNENRQPFWLACCDRRPGRRSKNTSNISCKAGDASQPHGDWGWGAGAWFLCRTIDPLAMDVFDFPF
jgi:hypothetical protein